LNFTDYLTFLARGYADNQMNMNSVERVEEYCNIQPEKYLIPSTPCEHDVIGSTIDAEGDLHTVRVDINANNGDGNNNKNNINNSSRSGGSRSSSSSSSSSRSGNSISSDNSISATCFYKGASVDESSIKASIVPSEADVHPDWPQKGAISFRCVNMRYETSPNLVLKNLSFDVPSRCKVGVVGRTGAGKSSLIATLFRLCEIESGSIHIDGVSIGDISLNSASVANLNCSARGVAAKWESSGQYRSF
jgi:ABC-type multidrug transport system fused ATPase/permease subunit